MRKSAKQAHEQNKKDLKEPYNTLSSPKNEDLADKESLKRGNDQQNLYKTAKKVNISIIIDEFKKNLKSIGPDKEVEKEVLTYIKLADSHSKKNNPSAKVIKSNLKNASIVLDNYISNTLKKPSEVVSNWINSLLLQNIDYKKQVKSPGADNDFQKTSLSNHKEQNNIVYLTVNSDKPIDEKPSIKKYELSQKQEKLIRDLYKKSQSFLNSRNYSEALKNYKKILELSKELGNKKTQFRVYMDIAEIYDIKEDYSKSIKAYNKALSISREASDKSTQAKIHYNIGSIYDDIDQTDKALNHYFQALSLDGETENLEGQSLTLNNIGNMFSVKKDYKKALEYYKLSFSLVKQTDNNQAKAVVLSNVAGIFRNCGYYKKALNYYANAVKYDILAANPTGYAKSYEQAGDIMTEMGKLDKAKNLYKKSLAASQKVGDRELL